MFSLIVRHDSRHEEHVTSPVVTGRQCTGAGEVHATRPTIEAALNGNGNTMYPMNDVV